MNLFELFVKIGAKDEASETISKITSGLGRGLVTAAKIGTAAVGAAATGIAALTTQAVNSFAEYEQLAGGAQKIFNDMDYSKIATDANNAYKELGLSANQYLAVINDVGATFAATMGDEAGYEAAKTGLKAISDYASGTGKNVDELSQKFTLITRSTSSYQSIADQFSGILPATSAGFLEQAQAAGILSDKYTQLTEVPIAEYQDAVSKMLEQGVADLGLANNTMDEAFSTLSGSLAMAKGAWSNLATGLADDSADIDMLIGNFVESVGAVATNIIPKIGTALNGASKLIRDLIPVIVQEIPALVEENLPILVEAAVSIIQSLMDGISQNQEMLFDTILGIVTYFSESFVTMLPQIVELGLNLIVSLANGIAESLPELIPTIVNVVLQIVETLIDNVDMLVDASIAIMIALADGLVNSIPKLIEKAPEIITKLIEAFVNNAPKMLKASLQIILSLAKGLITSIPELIKSIPKIVTSIVNGFLSFMGKIKDIGKNIVKGIWEGISSMVTWIKDKVTGFFDGIVGGVKDFLGIKSPSKVFASIGGYMAEGLGKGWENEYGDIKKQIEGDMNFGTATVDFASSAAGRYNGAIQSSLGDIAASINQNATIVVQSVLDGRVIGETAYQYSKNRQRAYGVT